MPDLPQPIPANSPDAAFLQPVSASATSAPVPLAADSPEAQALVVPAAVAAPVPAANAPEALVSQDDYLKMLPRDEIVREYRQQLQSGKAPDKEAYYRAYEARAHEGNLLGDTDQRLSATPKPSLFARVLDTAKTLDIGLLTQANEASKFLIGKDFATGQDLGGNWDPKSQKARAEALSNLVHGSGVAGLQTLNTLRQFGVNVGNYLFHHNNAIAGVQGINNETPNARDTSLFREQFDTDEKVQAASDRLLHASAAEKLATDPETVQAVATSPLSDPTFILPFALASKEAKAANAFRGIGADAAPEGASLLAKSVAKPIELAADAVKKAADLADNSPLVRAGVAGGATLLAGGNAPSAILAGLLGGGNKNLKVAQTLFSGTENALRAAAGRITGDIPLGPYSKFAANTFGQLTDEGKAFILAQAPNVPFLLGTENRKQAEDFAIVGALAHGAGNGFRMLNSGLDVNKNFFAPFNDTGEPRLPTADLGVSPTLDAEHAKTMSGVNDSGSNFVEGWRKFLKKTGVGEMYAVSPEGFRSALDELAASVGKKADEILPPGITPERAAMQRGLQVDLAGPDGKTRKVALVSVEPGVPGIATGHEITHMIFNSLSGEQQANIRQTLARDYGEEQVDNFRQKYAQDLGVKPEQVTREDALDELFAETGSAVLNSVPVSRFGPEGSKTWGGTVRKIYGLIGTALTNAGISVPEAAKQRAIESPNGSVTNIWEGAGKGPKTALGAQPSSPGSRLLENYLQAMALDKDVFAPAPEGSGEAATAADAARPNVPGVTEAAPPPSFKKGDKLAGDIYGPDGNVVGKDATILNVNEDEQTGNHTYDILFSSKGKVWKATVPEKSLQSPVKPGASDEATPAAPTEVFPKSPITDKTPFGAATPENTPTAKETVTPRQVENVVLPEASDFKDANGAVDSNAYGKALIQSVSDALAAGKKVELIVDNGGKTVEITGIKNGMMQDASGQRWGNLGILTGQDKVSIKETPPPAPSNLKNVHVTPSQQEAFAAKATPEVVKANTDLVKQSDALPTHEKPAYETNYYSAKGETGEDAGVREVRRKLADAAEKTGKKNPLRALYQKIFVPYRYVDGKTPRVFGFSYDKLIQNVDILKGWAASNNRPDLVTRLSDSQFANTVRDYLRNQSNGYGGDGRPVTLPADTRPGTITTRNPGFKPVKLAPADAQLVNLLIGVEQPQKSSPASQFAARMAKQNGLTPERNAAGVEITNPLYTELTGEGLNPKVLNSVVENLPIDRMTTPLKPRPDIQFPAGDLGITRAGFMPATREDYTTRAETFGGRLISSDLVRTSLPDYDPKDTGKTHEQAAYAANQLYREKLADPKVDNVIFTAGPAGAGKTVSIRGALEDQPNSVVFDSTLGGTRGIARIEDALNAGKQATVLFTYAPFETTLQRIKSRAEREGRTVPAESAATNYRASAENFLSLYEFLKDNPNIEFRVFDNSGDHPVAVDNPTEFLYKQLNETPDQATLHERAKEFLAPQETDAQRADKQAGGARPEESAGGSQETKVWNIGLNVEGGEPNSVEHVLSVLRKNGVEPKAYEIQQSGTEPTLVFKSGAVDDATVAKISDELKQDAIAVQYPDGTGKLLGPRAEKWGDFNPDFFLHPQEDKTAVNFLPYAKVQHAGEPLEHSLGKDTLNLIHFAGNQGLKEVDPKNFGKSGLTPRSELAGAPRSYFYEQGKTNKFDPVANRDDVYGAKVSGSKIYDGDTDPLGYESIINREKADRMLKDAGYVGIARTGDKYRQVELFQPTKVQSLESPKAKFLPQATPKQETAFKDSKVRDANGDLLPVFHGTYSDFKKFKQGDLGYHFGTQEAANARIGKALSDLNPHEISAENAFDAFPEMRENMPPGARGAIEGIADGARTLPVFLNLKNPLRMPDVGPWDDPIQVWNELPDGVWQALDKTANPALRKFKTAAQGLGAIRDGLKKLGYDGVVYQNAFEAAPRERFNEKGQRTLAANDSYIAFDNSQIMPVYSHDAKARFLPAIADNAEGSEKIAIPGNPKLQDARETRTYKNIARHLTPAEAKDIRRDTAQKIVDLYKELPADEDFETAAHAGHIKKGWYQRAADSLQFIFGPDTEKFVSLLAATSPRQSVQENLKMALNIWADWQDAGRPTHDADLKQVIEKHAEMHSRVPNSIRALQGEDLATPPKSADTLDKVATLSGPKVESFKRNLLGDLSASTNDTWMALFSNIDQAQFGTKSGYLAMNAKVRKVADKLNLKPAEVQETIWSFFKTLTEATTVDRPAKEALRNLTESDILKAPEFHEQILSDPAVKKQLERLGFTGFDSLARRSNPAVARAGSLANIALHEGGERRRLVLDRIAQRAQSLKDLEVSREAKVAPADEEDPF